MQRVGFFTLAGAISALLIWVPIELSPWLTTDPQPGLPPPPVNMGAVMTIGALLGLAVGAGIGSAEGFWKRAQAQVIRNAWIGALYGLLGGGIGIFLGQVVYGPWAGWTPVLQKFQPLLAFISQLTARTIGWGFIGLFVGLFQGLQYHSPQRLKTGVIGGLLGGLLGGFLFEILSYIIGVPEFSRAVGFTCIGGATGLGISLVEEVLKPAWIRVVVGRNEGRDYALVKETNILGRDELADIPLFGDPSVGKQHIVIRRVGHHWEIQDLGQPGGTFLNGRPVNQAVLKEGDRLQIGRFLLEFHEKGGVPSGSLRDEDRVRSPSPPPVPEGICAFCGQPKDPVTGQCACTPVSPPGLAVQKVSSTVVSTANLALEVVGGVHSGRQFRVKPPETTLGRDLSRDIIIDWDSTVSRRHATLFLQNGQWWIRDEGSANGTFVNGQRVTEKPLQIGDHLKLGNTQLVLRSVEGVR